MPCWTTTQTQIELGAKTDAGLIHKALAALELNPRQAGQFIYFRNGQYDAATGRLTLNGRTEQANQDAERNIKRAYGAQVARSQAARFGWTVQEIPGNPYRFNAVKR